MIFDFCFEIDLINLNRDQTLNRSNPEPVKPEPHNHG
jgi:hypothetical protein